MTRSKAWPTGPRLPVASGAALRTAIPALWPPRREFVSLVADSLLAPADGDIGIAFSGLRSGEDLHEDLFDRSGSRIPTEVQSVCAGRPRQPPPMVGAMIHNSIAAAKCIDGPETADMVWATLASIEVEGMVSQAEEGAPRREALELAGRDHHGMLA